ncbi:hypothetical protein [Pseudomonas aeruginosa]|uniref:hypothetical protein n=1 Tax=Pseudomonas aeruginosa TaxID=287 RepID=UPI0031FE593C
MKKTSRFGKIRRLPPAELSDEADIFVDAEYAGKRTDLAKRETVPRSKMEQVVPWAGLDRPDRAPHHLKWVKRGRPAHLLDGDVLRVHLLQNWFDIATGDE